jgi:hypothetical protein
MSRVIIARSSEWADGTIGRMLTAFQAQADAKDRRAWIEEQKARIATAEINLFFINEAATEFDKRCINLSKGEAK